MECIPSNKPTGMVEQKKLSSLFANQTDHSHNNYPYLHSLQNSKVRFMESFKVPHFVHFGSGLSRRKSLSCPQDVNLFLQIAEYSWQHKPEVEEKDYFDEIQAEQDNQRSYDGHHPPPAYEPIRTDESEEFSEFSDGGSEPPRQVLRFVSPKKESTVRENSPTPTKDNDDTCEEDDDDEYFGLSRLRRIRKKSATRPPNIQDLDTTASKGKSLPINKADGLPIQSKKGLANRIKVKFTQVSNSLPLAFRKRKSPEYKIQIFVGFMFLTIVFLVGSIYVIHHEKELQKSYFDRIRFSGKDRRIRVVNLKGREVLTGTLGTTLSVKDKAWECLEANRRSGPCLEWMNIARLHFRVTNPRRDWDPSLHRMECYGILWESLSPDFVPIDCFHLSDARGYYFYGGGELAQNQWPLSRSTIPLSPFITGSNGKGQWGRALRRFFVGSPGVGIEISKETPLHISINDAKNPGKFCLAAKNDFFAYPTHEGPPILNYTFCTGESIRDVFTQLADKEIWDGLRHEDVHITHGLANSPVWRILPETIKAGNSSEAAIFNHTDRIGKLELSEGFILLDESWQREMGDLEMDPDRFTNIGETVNITKRHGFKVALTVQPYFSTQSINYVRGVEKGLWVRQSLPGYKKGLNIPALTSYKGSPSVVLLDITKKAAKAWIQRKLNDLIRKYGIDALFIDFGSTHYFPQYYDFRGFLSSPDEYKEIFMRSVKNLNGVYAIGTSSAVKLPKLPTFVALSPIPSTWEGLQSIIPNLLTLGVAGYPFVIPGAIGGDYMMTSSDEITLSANSSQEGGDGFASFERIGRIDEDRKPERELFARWLELGHFLPVVHYTHLPSEYDSQLIQLAQELKSRRKVKLYPYIKKAINDALTTGLPIIRPLWMSDPLDINCLKIWDEFTIGGDILVAPILTPNKTEREIYLPRGRWRDEMDGSSTKGERWIHHYRIRINQIAFFTKLEDPS